MTNKELIRAIAAGRVKPGQARTYAARVTARKDAPECKHGHFGCALVERGPCMDETLALYNDKED